MTDPILINLVEARNNFYKHRRTEMAERQFLLNEQRILDAHERYSVQAALMRIMSTPVLNFMDPVTVAPTQQQLQNALIPANAASGQCSICQDPLSDGGPTVSLRNCLHTFHRHCADSWYSRSVFCPLCRNDIRTSSS